MDFSIFLSCTPSGPAGSDGGDGPLVMVIDQGGEPVATGDGLVAAFDVEGAIVGDDRTYQRATFLRTSDPVDDLTSATSASGESFVLVLDPFINSIAASITGL